MPEFCIIGKYYLRCQPKTNRIHLYIQQPLEVEDCILFPVTIIYTLEGIKSLLLVRSLIRFKNNKMSKNEMTPDTKKSAHQSAMDIER